VAVCRIRHVVCYTLRVSTGQHLQSRGQGGSAGPDGLLDCGSGRSQQPRPRRPSPTWLVGIDLTAVAIFLAAEQQLGAAASLALAGALPAAWTLADWARRRSVDRLALASIAIFALGATGSLLFGGDLLPMKLARPTAVGILGLICLASAAINRPVLAIAAGLIGTGGRGGFPLRRREYRIATILLGLVALIDCLTQVALALTLSTANFVLIGSAARWSILGCGGAITLRYLRRQRGAEEG
jgi:hypothetical protein